jgi:hypothetical protein
MNSAVTAIDVCMRALYQDGKSPAMGRETNIR